jgi:hypothetical protein
METFGHPNNRLDMVLIHSTGTGFPVKKEGLLLARKGV